MKKWIGGLAVLVAAVIGVMAYMRASVLTPEHDQAAVPSTQAPVASASLAAPIAAATIAAASATTPADQRQAQVLDQIIASKNDNDPRLDTDLRELGPGAKALFRERYEKYAPENRNERGTVVFLLGRNLSSAEDFKFMGDVLSEPPCQSLENCARVAERVNSEDKHHDSATEVTLAYPQIVALKSIERYLSNPNRNPSFVEAAMANLRAARESKNDKVAHLAADILSRL